MKATTRKRLSEGKQFALQQVHAMRGRADGRRLCARERKLWGASADPASENAGRDEAEWELLRVVEDENALRLHLRIGVVEDERDGFGTVQTDDIGATQAEDFGAVQIDSFGAIANERKDADAARTDGESAAHAAGDRIEWTCLDADGGPVPCEARVIARDAETSELCVSLRIPKKVESLLVIASAHSEIAGERPLATMSIDEGTLWQALRANRELVASARDDYAYPRWFAAHRTTQDALDAQRLASLPEEPIFSIVVPLFRTPPAFFRDMLESVRTQTYPVWQLVLVNASPEDDALARAVTQAAAAEPRITVVPLRENLGITLNTNAGIDASIGDFVAFFDHDDIMEPNLLFEYARAVNEHPDTDMLYCDEDNLLPNGDFMHPFFKPDFQPDLLRRRNYLCHLLAVRKSLLDELEPAGRSFDGSQDHNCALRIAETARRVTHVPKLLYHWRVNPESVAGNPDAKDYCNEAGILAVSEHLSRIGAEGTVGRAGLPFRYRIRYDVPEEPCVSLVVPCLHGNACDASAAGAAGGAGGAGSASSAESRYLRSCNDAARTATDEYLLFASPGTVDASPEWMETMLGFCMQPGVGAVGAKTVYPDGTVKHAGLAFVREAGAGAAGEGDAKAATGTGAAGAAGEAPIHVIRLDFAASAFQGSYFDLADDPQNADAVSAECLMTRRTDFLELGGFDESLPFDLASADYCLRLRRAGKRIVYAPDAVVTQVGLRMPDAADVPAEDARSRFDREWGTFVAEAPRMLNPNLSQDPVFGPYRHLGKAYADR